MWNTRQEAQNDQSFLKDHIKKYVILKRDSKNLSKVNIAMMGKYMEYKCVTWNKFKYFWNFSGKPNNCPAKPRNVDMPNQSFVTRKKTIKYFWLTEKFTSFTLNKHDKAITCEIIINTLNEASNYISDILESFSD